MNPHLAMLLQLAFCTLSRLSMPLVALVALYAIYSLIYEEHESFISWALYSLAVAVQILGTMGLWRVGKSILPRGQRTTC
jgi:hypothetical protein